MSDCDFSDLLERFDFLTERPSGDHAAFNCPSSKLLELSQFLKDEYAFNMLLDITQSIGISLRHVLQVCIIFIRQQRVRI